MVDSAGASVQLRINHHPENEFAGHRVVRGTLCVPETHPDRSGG